MDKFFSLQAKKTNKILTSWLFQDPNKKSCLSCERQLFNRVRENYATFLAVSVAAIL